MFVDTHAHLDFPQFEGDIAETVRRAVDNGVKKIVNIGTSVDSSRRVVEIAERFEECFATVGVHPHDAKDVDEKCLEELEILGRHEKVVAVGTRINSPKVMMTMLPQKSQKEFPKAMLPTPKA